jgi:hypothetical protein
MAKFKIPRVECESGRSRGRSDSKGNSAASLAEVVNARRYRGLFALGESQC